MKKKWTLSVATSHRENKKRIVATSHREDKKMIFATSHREDKKKRIVATFHREDSFKNFCRYTFIKIHLQYVLYV
jgi:hypothetical protein